jgi:hypothetical protein
VAPADRGARQRLRIAARESEFPDCDSGRWTNPEQCGRPAALKFVLFWDKRPNRFTRQAAAKVGTTGQGIAFIQDELAAAERVSSRIRVARQSEDNPMQFIRGFRVSAGAALIGLLVLASGATTYAQTANASVSGAVKDASGAILPGASVTLTSRTQGNTQTTTVNGQGNFVFPVVRPDTYTLKVAMQGFKTLEQTNLVVNANDKLSAGTLTLEVGQLAEAVTVSSRVSELQTTSGERSFSLESAALQNIANNGRSVFGFTTLVPGIVPQDGNGGTRVSGPPEQVSGFTANGQRPNSNNMTIDGVANIDTGDNGGNMAELNIDSVEEMKVLTNAYQAEYGRAVGAQLQAITKSGSQSFHGSAYWFGRRSGWNANTWTNKRAEAPAPVGNGALIELPDSSRDDYGYTIGGPIFIPGVFNQDKTKLFFFWAQEWQKRKDAVADRWSRVPTELERQGDFSQSIDANTGAVYPYIKDWTSPYPCSATDTRGCYQDGGVVGRIPANRLYQPGLNALRMFPSSNTSGSDGNNYISQAPTDAPRGQQLLRIDFQPSDKWRITARYLHSSNTQEQPYGTTWAGAGSNNLDTIGTTFDQPGNNILLSATGILNASTSIELSVGRAHNSLKYAVGNQNLRRAVAGLSDMPLLYPSAVQEDYIPDMRFNNGRVGGNAGFYQTDRGPFVNENTTWDVVANLTKTWGPHVSKLGVYYQSSYKPQSPFASFNSQIQFQEDSSNPYDTGFSYANAATGVYRNYIQASTYALPEWVYKNYEGFIQDNWKLGRLTLDYGVRFYYMTPQWDQSLAASTFLPEKYDKNNEARLYFPVCVNGRTTCSGNDRRGMDPALVGTAAPTAANTVEGRFIGRVVPGTNRFNGAYKAGEGINDSMQSGNAFRVSPRFGFVFDVTGRGTTIVRGGTGIFYDRAQGNMVFGNITNAPGMLQSQLQWGRLQDMGGSSTSSDPDTVLNMAPIAYDFKTPTVYAWNIGVQQKLPKGVMLDVSYVGSISRNLLRQQQINSVPYGAKFLPENQDPTAAPSSVPGATALPDDFLRPYKGYGNIQYVGYDGRGNYNALQTSLSRRFDNGLMFQAFYVWSKTMTDSDTDFFIGRFNASESEIHRADWSYAASDRPHTFVLNLVYQTPRLTDNRLLGLLANNWQISGIYRWMSGTPYAITFTVPDVSAGNLTGSDTNNNARVVLSCDPGKGWSSDPYNQINAACFAPPQPGSDGTESSRYFLHGPPINNLDLSIGKGFQLGKVAKLDVRLDMFNALNQTQFTGVNANVSFASLSDRTVTNGALDANGNVVRNQGFGSITGVRPPRTLQLTTRISF